MNDFGRIVSIIVFSIIVTFGIPLGIGLLPKLFSFISYCKEGKKFRRMYEDKPLESLIEIPFDSEIGEDGYPKEKTSEDWGSKYTVWTEYEYSSEYHKTKGCHGCFVPKNVCKIGYFDKPCVDCTPELPDLRWYEDYLKIKSIIIEHRIRSPFVPAEKLRKSKVFSYLKTVLSTIIWSLLILFSTSYVSYLIFKNESLSLYYEILIGLFVIAVVPLGIICIEQLLWKLNELRIDKRGSRNFYDSPTLYDRIISSLHDSIPDFLIDWSYGINWGALCFFIAVGAILFIWIHLS